MYDILNNLIQHFKKDQHKIYAEKNLVLVRNELCQSIDFGWRADVGRLSAFADVLTNNDV